MTEAGERLMAALEALDDVAKEMTPEQAAECLDTADLQVFWRDWPHSSAWAGALWRRLSEDLAGPATPQTDVDLDEVGGPG